MFLKHISNRLPSDVSCGPMLLSTTILYTYIWIIYQSFPPVQDMYADDRRVWNRIFQMVSEDLALCEAGLDVGNDTIYPIVLGNKGDWSYLVP